MIQIAISRDHTKATIFYETHNVNIVASHGESIIDLIIQILCQSQKEAA